MSNEPTNPFALKNVYTKVYGKDASVIEHLIPLFIEELKDCSPSYAASRVGFVWDYWRHELLKRPDVQEAYASYSRWLRRKRKSI